MTNSAAEDCRQMAAYIEEHGWVQGKLEIASGEVCLDGALCKVVPAEQYDRRRSCRDAISSTLGHRYIPMWNDMLGRTKEDVVKMLLQTADRLDVSDA